MNSCHVNKKSATNNENNLKVSSNNHQINPINLTSQNETLTESDVPVNRFGFRPTILPRKYIDKTDTSASCTASRVNYFSEQEHKNSNSFVTNNNNNNNSDVITRSRSEGPKEVFFKPLIA